MGITKIQRGEKIEKNNLTVILQYWPILFLVTLSLIFSSPYILRGQVPFPSRYLVSFFNPWINYYGMAYKNGAMPDVITQIYPWKKITINSLKQGILPVWNPFQFSGNPHLANVQSAVFTPFNLLFFILPFIDAWSLLILFQPLLAGSFMFLYLRSIERSKYSSLMGSIAFMFSSYIVTWMAYGTLGYALLYLPLLLYGIERLIKRNDFVSHLSIAVSIPLSIFSGHFQTSLYIIIVGLVYLFIRLYQVHSKKIIISGVLAVGAGLLVSCLQLFPTYHFYMQADRSVSYIANEAIPFLQLVRIFAPDFFGNPVTRNDWIGHYAEWGTYAGIIPLFFALLAFFRKKNFYIVFFKSLFLIALLFSFIPPFVQLLSWSRIPVLATSNPSRIVGVISFSIAVLSAFGFDYLLSDWDKKTLNKNSIMASLIMLVFFIVIWVLIFTKNKLLFGQEIDHVQIATRNFVMPSFLFGVSLFAVVIGYTKIKYSKWVAICLLLLLTSFEMLRFSTKWQPFEPKEFVYPEVTPLQYLKNNAHENRVYGLLGNEVFGMFGLYGIEGYDPLYIKRYGEFISALGDGQIHSLSRSTVVFPRQGLYAKQALDLMGVKYLMHSRGDGQGSWLFPFWNYPESYGKTVFTDDKYEIYENKNAYPRAYLVHDYHVQQDSDKIIELLFSSGINLREQAIIEEKPYLSAEEMKSCKVIDDEKAAIDYYADSSVIITTKSSCDAILFLSDVYYPGWVAYIDHTKVPLYRANYTFRGVIVPKGEHTVVMKYENWYL